MVDAARHWQDVWSRKDPGSLSWTQADAGLSLRWIGAEPRRVLDVGSGASVLVGALVDAGHAVCVLDISPAAVERARSALGDRADAVDWRVGDVCDPIEGVFDVWHDRAVFHFLTDPDDRRRYVGSVERVLPPGGRAIVATFAPDGPESCSGLPVRRYDADGLAAAFGEGFRLVDAAREVHVTPWGSEQPFQYVLLERTSPPP